jgi:hypothetical protein
MVTEFGSWKLIQMRSMSLLLKWRFVICSSAVLLFPLSLLLCELNTRVVLFWWENAVMELHIVTKIGFVYVLCRFVDCQPWFLWAKIQRNMPYALKDYFLDKSFGTSLTRNYSFFILVLKWRSKRGPLLDLCQLCMYFSSPNVLPLP